VLIYFQLTDCQISIFVPQKNNHFSQSLCIAISFIYSKHFSCTILSIILTIALENSTFLFPHLAKVYWSGFYLTVFTGGWELAHYEMNCRLVKSDFERSKCKLYGRFGYTYRCCLYSCSIRVCKQILCLVSKHFGQWECWKCWWVYVVCESERQGWDCWGELIC